MKIIILLLALGLYQCETTTGKFVARNDNEKLIQRTWHLTGTLPKTEGGSVFMWFLEWTFSSDRTFLHTGYPPLSQKGKYRILKKDGDKLTLELYEQSGTFGTKDKQIEIVIDKDKETLKIDGKEGFKRVREKKKEANDNMNSGFRLSTFERRHL